MKLLLISNLPRNYRKSAFYLFCFILCIYDIYNKWFYPACSFIIHKSEMIFHFVLFLIYILQHLVQYSWNRKAALLLVMMSTTRLLQSPFQIILSTCDPYVHCKHCTLWCVHFVAYRNKSPGEQEHSGSVYRTLICVGSLLTLFTHPELCHNWSSQHRFMSDLTFLFFIDGY